MGNNCACTMCEPVQSQDKTEVNLDQISDKAQKKQPQEPPISPTNEGVMKQSNKSLKKSQQDENNLAKEQLNNSMMSSGKRAKLPQFKDNSSYMSIKKASSFVENYQGDILNNQRHGYGIQVWPDKSVYKGHWEQDKPNGKGQFIYTDGSVFIGTFLQGKASGKGIFIEKDGSQWAGNWIDDLLNGVGIEKNQDYTYEGEYVNGYREGYGKAIWSDTSCYSGQWYCDKIEGYGVYSWADGKKYEGEWIANYMHGKGVLKDVNGNIYEGEFLNDTKHGYGYQIFLNEDKYEGVWHMDKLEGLVKIQKNNERTCELIQYKNGIEIKRFEQCYLHSIIPSDWISPQQQNRNRQLEIQKHISANKEEVNILYKLIEKEQKSQVEQQQIE